MFFLDVVLFVGFVGKNNMMLYFCSVLYMGSIIDFVLLTHKQQTKPIIVTKTDHRLANT